MKISEKMNLVIVLNKLARERELVISDFKTEELLSGEDIRRVVMEEDVIHIYLSESIFVRREKK